MPQVSHSRVWCQWLPETCHTDYKQLGESNKKRDALHKDKELGANYCDLILLERYEPWYITQHDLCIIKSDLNKQTSGLFFKNNITIYGSWSFWPLSWKQTSLSREVFFSWCVCQAVDQNRSKNFKEEIFQLSESFFSRLSNYHMLFINIRWNRQKTWMFIESYINITR